jgi:4-hydroxybenzoate polyprenyltransferase
LNKLIPLVVDLDGTLIFSDTLHESAIILLRNSPLSIFKLPFWLVTGKANLKSQIADFVQIDPELLPYNHVFLDFLKKEHDKGRQLVLCTAADRSIADLVASHVGLFCEVIASDGKINLAGSNKAAALVSRFGKGCFDYAGNSSADFDVWDSASAAVVVNASPSVQATAVERYKVSAVFEPAHVNLSIWHKVLRLHQWMKNLLLFLPLLAAHEIGNLGAWQSLVLAFFAFSLCASTVYIVNDLLDLDNDRRHPRKRMRPFASGAVPVWKGVALAPVLLGVSFVLAFQVGAMFVGWLLAYFVVTCLYSFSLKKLILVDCLTLAMLYTFRILAGSATVGHVLSLWLLAFSVFLFLSLAFVKRYAELEVQRLNGSDKAHGRGYHTDDASLLQNFGVSSGQASVLVLALYLNSDAVTKLYVTPEVIWCAVPVMLFWIHWMWMQAHRGNMHDDPVVFAVKDKVSLLTALLLGAILVSGATGVWA